MSTEVIAWGLENEPYVPSTCRYFSIMHENHKHFSVSQSGLVLHPDFPYLGASPDGIVKCDCCCSSGVLEIKGSFRCKSRSLIEASKEGNQFCLQLNKNGCFELDMQHAYFYQVQAQMKLTGADYCDFVVWSPNEFIVLRISPDAEFIAQAIDKVTNFFKLGVLPELVVKWYTKAPHYRHTPEDSTSTHHQLPTTDLEQWCYCQGPEEGEMIYYSKRKVDMSGL